MRVIIEHDSEPRLRIIREIPDLPVCQLEGRNGIGKTLAVRLLELASGRQPYQALPRAWASLCEALKDVVITVDRLRGGETIEYSLTPDQWDPDVNVPLPLEAIAKVRINGNQSTVAAAIELVQVERLAGDETLAHTLAADLVAQQIEIQPLVNQIESEVSVWQRRADSVLVTSRGINPQSLQAAWRSVQEAKEAREAASVDLKAASEVEWSFQHAASMRVRAETVRVQVPLLVAEVAQVEEQLAAFRATRAALWSCQGSVDTGL